MRITRKPTQVSESEEEEEYEDTPILNETEFVTEAGTYQLSFRETGAIVRVNDEEYHATSHIEEHKALYDLLVNLHQSSLLTNKTSSLWTAPMLLHIGRLLDDGRKLGFDSAEVVERDDRFGNDWQVWVAEPDDLFDLTRGLEITLSDPTISTSYIRQAGHVNTDVGDTKLEIKPALRKMLYLAVQAGQSTIRGTVTDGQHFIFLLLEVNPNPSGPHSFCRSHRWTLADREILETEMQFLSDALAYWVSHSHDAPSAENPFFKVLKLEDERRSAQD
ncbi:hypothetical protein ONZ45_g2299 [Pleurotus djamor]|nr:hypothetical protein ONZ45_g2299 [Pleurotus djamor]